MTKMSFRVLACVSFLLAQAPINAQAQDEDYMLLESQFGEICTMCEAIVVCKAEPFGENDSITSLETYMAEDFTLYHFLTKTFWGQIMTIWDYFAKWINPVTSEKRPVIVYEHSLSNPDTKSEETAYLSMKDKYIDVQDRRIDRISNEWSKGGNPLGSCERFSLRDILPILEGASDWQVKGGQ